MEVSLFDKIAPIVALFTVVIPLLSFGLFPNFTRAVLRALFDMGEEVSHDEIDHTMSVMSNRAEYNSRNMSIDELFQEEIEPNESESKIREGVFYFDGENEQTFKNRRQNEKYKLEKVG